MTNQNKLEIRTLPIDIQVSKGDKLNVQGYVNMTGSVSEVLTNPVDGKQFRETIMPEVFSNAIEEASRVDFLYQHDKMLVLASTSNQSLSLAEDSKGLFMRATISETSWGKDTYQLIQDGIIQGMSFGMIVTDEEWTLCDDGLPLRIITAIQLFEISAVRNPAYRSSTIEARDIDQVTNIEIPDNIEKREDTMAESSTEKAKDKSVEKEVVETKDTDKSKQDAKKSEKRDDSSVDDIDKTDTEERAIDDDKSGLESVVRELITKVDALLNAKTSEKRDNTTVDDEDLEDRAKTEAKDEKPEDKAKTTEKTSEKSDENKTDDSAKPADKADEKDSESTDKNKKPFPFQKKEKRELLDFFNIETREVK